MTDGSNTDISQAESADEHHWFSVCHGIWKQLNELLHRPMEEKLREAELRAMYSKMAAIVKSITVGTGRCIAGWAMQLNSILGKLFYRKQEMDEVLPLLTNLKAPGPDWYIRSAA